MVALDQFKMGKLKPHSGFSLTEILIGLAIIGVIATFAVPKFKDASDLKTQKDNVKAAGAQIVAAYNLYRMENNADASTDSTDFLPYLDHVKVTTTGSVDRQYSLTTVTCTSSRKCYHLNNGAVVWSWATSETFNGTTNKNAVTVYVDPDGKVTDGGGGTTSGKSSQLFIYYDGKFRERSQILSSTNTSQGNYNPSTTFTPPYWSWD